jgi:hypothetical protein
MNVNNEEKSDENVSTDFTFPEHISKRECLGPQCELAEWGYSEIL